MFPHCLERVGMAFEPTDTTKSRLAAHIKTSPKEFTGLVTHPMAGSMHIKNTFEAVFICDLPAAEFGDVLRVYG